MTRMDWLARHRAARLVWWLALVAIALAGIGFHLRATTRGAGISPDSTAYISMAREMLIPFGFTFVVQPRDDFPPVYPALLALGGAVSGDPATAARWLNAILFGANIFLVGWILKRILPHSFWAPLVGAWLMLTSITMLNLHAMAWSEPTFLFFGMNGMIALASYIERQQLWRLVAAGVLMGLAAMDRYVGISLACTGIGALLVLMPGSLRRKLGSAVLFAALAYLPLAGWLTQRPTRRMLTFLLAPPEYWQVGFDNMSRLVIPGANPLLEPARPWLVLGLVLVLALGAWYVWRRKTRQVPPQVLLSRVPTLFYIVTLFMVLYPLAHVAAKTLFSPSITLHPRALSPVFVSGLLFFISAVSVIYASFRPSSLVLRLGMAVLVLAFLWSTLSSARLYVERIRVEGLGYNSVAWRESPIMAQIRTLPPDLMIYSNGSDAIYYLTSRPVTRLPNKVDKMNLIGNAAYLAELHRVGAQVAAGRGVIVYLEGFPDRWYQPNEQDLTRELPLALVARAADGAIFR